MYYKEDKTDVYWVHFTGFEVEKILNFYNRPVLKPLKNNEKRGKIVTGDGKWTIRKD